MHFLPPEPPAVQQHIPRFWETVVFRAMAAVTLALALTAILVVSFVTRSTNDAMSRATVAALDSEGAALRRVYMRDGLDRLIRTVQDRIEAGDTQRYRLTDATGQMLAGNLREPPVFGNDSRGGGTFRYKLSAGDADGDDRLAAARVFTLANNLTLIVARDIEPQRVFLTSATQSLGLGVGFLALVGLAAGIALSRHILGRVDAMTAASRSIMAGNLAERLPRTGTGDELDRLAGSLNAMLDRIELLMEGMKEVSDNIAHDLKTPLNRLRNRAEAALADTRGSPAWRTGLEHTIEDADELMKTFNALLLIARLEAGAVENTMSSVDLDTMVEDLAELYAPAAEEAGHDLSWHAETNNPVQIRANRQLLGQAIANLIENAIKYAAPESATPPLDRSNIAVSLRTSGRRADIVVADRGPGIAPEDRDRAMRRFVRLEASRTKPGTGLGLSLVAAVARLHGGELRLEDNGPGLRAILSLPMIYGLPNKSGTQDATQREGNQDACSPERTS